MEKHALLKWRLAGMVALLVFGFLLHFIFGWAGESRFMAWLVPVNESVWEHLKLGYWSVVLFSWVEYPRLKPQVNNYFLARLVGIVLLELTILAIYYSYTTLSGDNIVVVDIASYLVGVVACQYVTYAIFGLKPLSRSLERMALVVWFALGILLAVTTYYPPHKPIFKDQNTNEYGIKGTSSTP
ncbi:MAG: hypothetical protein JNN04_17485 [Cyclobacteriaceae bacterium]|nr:hypothetical protein [Cyclobacteriaceae bacterium]